MSAFSPLPVLAEQPSSTMKFVALSVVALLAIASAEEGREKYYNKRSPVGYPSPTSRPGFAAGGASSSSGVSYTKSALGSSGQKSFTPSQLHYASQPSDNTASSSPVTFGGSQQQYDFQTPSFGKAFAAGQSTPYSPASDVSSFSFNSPSVQYNSQGYLQQLAGKLAAAAPADQSQQFAYTATPGKFASFAAPAASGPVTFAAAPQSAQKYSFAAPAYSAGAPSKYQFAASPQQVLYAAAPQHPAFQSFAGGVPLQAAQSQQLYAVAPSQQAAYTSNRYYGGAADGYAAQ